VALHPTALIDHGIMADVLISAWHRLFCCGIHPAKPLPHAFRGKKPKMKKAHYCYDITNTTLG
jgi:hypothetical protein